MIRIGMFIGERYEIVEKIGSGGMSDVYKAKDHKLNRYIAVKILKQEFNSDRNFISKFKTEAQSAACLSHPNIVNVYDVGDEEDIHYIVMELIDGVTLKKYIQKKGRLEARETIGIAIQVAQGLEAAHAQNIIHRDIKPQNIIISKEGKVKVADFGIARAATAQTISSNAMGSVHYISPEQARGGYCDERSDIYSLGVTVYEMVTGRVPFMGDSTVSVALLHIQSDMPSPKEFEPSIPISLEKIIMKATQKKPEARYQSVSSMIADLKRSLMEPDEDFVKIVPVTPSTGETRVISDDEMAQIKESQKPEYDIDDETAYLLGIDDDDDELEKDSDDDDDEDDDEYDEEENEDVSGRFEKIMTGVGIGAAVLIVVLAIYVLGSFFGLFNFSGSDNKESTTEETSLGTEVEMPYLIGMDSVEAQDALEELGLKAKLSYEQDTNYDENQVIDQEFEKGTMVKRGQTIKITINSYSKYTEVPDGLVGYPKKTAVTLVERSDLVAEIEEVFSDTVAEGYVISVNPETGQQVEKGSTVKLTISKGPEIKTVDIPSVIGKTYEEAYELLSAAKFKVNRSEVNSDTVASGVVMDQSLTGKAEEGTTITLTVSSGSNKVVVPNLSGMSKDEAQIALEKVELVANFVWEDNNAPANTVFNQEYSSGSLVAAGTTVTVYLSNGPQAPTPAPTTPTTAAEVQTTTTEDSGSESGTQDEPPADAEGGNQG